MPSNLLVVLRDRTNDRQYKMDIPSDYTTVHLLSELIQAQRLECVNAQGQPLRYLLRRARQGEILNAHTTLAQSKILRGETIELYRAVVGETAYGNPYGSDEAIAPALPGEVSDAYLNGAGGPEPYWHEAGRLRAAGDYEKALAILLKQWRIQFRKRRPGMTTNVKLRGKSNKARPLIDQHPVVTSVPAELEQLVGQIVELFLQLVDEQLLATSFEEFYNLLKTDDCTIFIEINAHWRDVMLERLNNGSFELARQGRYQNARDFAILALQIKADDPEARKLESLANQYLEMQATMDSQERLIIARAIYAENSRYGAIGQELRETLRRVRRGENFGPTNDDETGDSYLLPAPGQGDDDSEDPNELYLSSATQVPLRRALPAPKDARRGGSAVEDEGIAPRRSVLPALQTLNEPIVSDRGPVTDFIIRYSVWIVAIMMFLAFVLLAFWIVNS